MKTIQIQEKLNDIRTLAINSIFFDGKQKYFYYRNKFLSSEYEGLELLLKEQPNLYLDQLMELLESKVELEILLIYVFTSWNELMINWLNVYIEQNKYILITYNENDKNQPEPLDEMKYFNRFCLAYNNYRKFIFETSEYEWGRYFFWYEFSYINFKEFIGNLVCRLNSVQCTFPGENLNVGILFKEGKAYKIEKKEYVVLPIVNLLKLKESKIERTGAIKVRTNNRKNVLLDYLHYNRNIVLDYLNLERPEELIKNLKKEGVKHIKGDKNTEDISLYNVSENISIREIEEYKKSYLKNKKNKSKYERYIELQELRYDCEDMLKPYLVGEEELKELREWIKRNKQK